ncbi:mitochondrial dynamics protein MID51-like [Asterias amurensis]|uniref:mitochondrial dynamics protein MID51-like n=1 Tax=Asterias amurensis TaxID=7602 RepID=UPI003AB13E8B
MASGGRKHDDGGSGSWLLTGLKIGAALGAAALGTYAAVRAAQQEEKEKETPMTSRCSEDSFKDEGGRQDYPSSFSSSQFPREESNPTSHAPRGVSKPKKKPSGSLIDELQEYFDTKISFPSDKNLVIQNLVLDTRERLSSYLVKNQRRLVKGDLVPAAFDKMVLKQGEEFRLMLPIAFDPKMWEFIDAADTILDMPGYFCVRRTNIDFYSMGRSPWDRFLIGSYLCPELLQDFLRKIIDQSIKEGTVFDFYCNVKRNAGGVELNVENPVRGFGNTGMLRIKIIPYMSMKINDKIVTLIAQSVIPSHPAEATTGNTNPNENLWLQSFEVKAVCEMESMDLDGGCRWKCLAILDALGSTHQPLRMLSRYQMITILLKMCREETEWAEEMLAERVLDLLKAVEEHLKAGTLMDFFNKKVDLFAHISPVKISESQKWLAHVLESKDRISNLLY